MLDAGVGFLDLGLQFLEFRSLLLDLVLEFPFSLLEFRESLLERVDLVEFLVDAVALALAPFDLLLNLLGVDRAHDELPEVDVGLDRPTGLVGLQQEREQVRDLRVVEVRVPLRAYPRPRAFQPAFVGRSVDFEADVPLVGVTLDRNLVAPQCSHHRSEERRLVRRVRTGQNRHPGRDIRLGPFDSADVLDSQCTRHHITVHGVQLFVDSGLADTPDCTTVPPDGRIGDDPGEGGGLATFG